jgi:hypothetical protein
VRFLIILLDEEVLQSLGEGFKSLSLINNQEEQPNDEDLDDTSKTPQKNEIITQQEASCSPQKPSLFSGYSTPTRPKSIRRSHLFNNNYEDSDASPTLESFGISKTSLAFIEGNPAILLSSRRTECNQIIQGVDKITPTKTTLRELMKFEE